MFLISLFTVLNMPHAFADDLSFKLPIVGDTTFNLTNTTTLQFRGENYDVNNYDDDFFALTERLDFAFQTERLRLEMRVDAFVPFSFDPAWIGSPSCPEGDSILCYIKADVRPERMVLRYEHESWRLEAGDTQLVLGRGAALSFRKVDLLAVDNALRGAHVRYDGETFNFRVHGGLANPQNQDPKTLAINPEPEDMVLGGQMGINMGTSNPTKLEVHAARVWFMDDPQSAFINRTIDVAGASLEWPSLFDGKLNVYLEANGLRRTQKLSGMESANYGRSIYGSAQYSDGNATLQFEIKDYNHFIIAPTATEPNAWRIYSAAPAVEFDGPQRLRAIDNQRGASLRFDYAFLPGPYSFSLNTNLYAFNEEPGEDPFDGVLVTHSWATFARRQEPDEDTVWSVELTGGYRHESFLHDPLGPFNSGDQDRHMIHGQVDVTLGKGDHSFDIILDHRFEKEAVFSEYTEFEIGGASITYTYGIPFSLTLSGRWADQNPGITEARGRQGYNFLGDIVYPSIDARYNFDPGTYMRLFLGSTPGGRLCSGGVCRDVPPYEGVLLQYIARL